jgi:hypothetical protein
MLENITKINNNGSLEVLKDCIEKSKTIKKDSNKRSRIKKALCLFTSYNGALETGSVIFNS